MNLPVWQRRILESTRGRVLTLLRRGSRTVNELAASLGLTDNAVRTHLSALERDGLIEQQGVRRAFGKPAYEYRLAESAEAFFPKAYATVMTAMMAKLREERGKEGLEEFLRAVGKDAGNAFGNEGPMRDKIEAAVKVLGDLGGLADVEEENDAFVIKGYSCPLSAVVRNNPEACSLAEELVEGIVGAEVTECCDRSDPPRCRFHIGKPINQ